MKCRKCFIFAAVLVALVVLSAMPSWAAGVKKIAFGNVNLMSVNNRLVNLAAYEKTTSANALDIRVKSIEAVISKDEDKGMRYPISSADWTAISEDLTRISGDVESVDPRSSDADGSWDQLGEILNKTASYEDPKSEGIVVNIKDLSEESQDVSREVGGKTCTVSACLAISLDIVSVDADNKYVIKSEDHQILFTALLAKVKALGGTATSFDHCVKEESDDENGGGGESNATDTDTGSGDNGSSSGSNSGGGGNSGSSNNNSGNSDNNNSGTNNTGSSENAFSNLDDGTPETQQAITDATEALDNAGVDAESLSPGELEALVENKKQETVDAQNEAANGVVRDTSVPAATNLISDVEALKELSATPKVTQPKGLEAAEQQQAVASLSAIEGINADEVITANPENIEIGSVPASLEEQASIITSLLENIAEALTKIVNANTPNGVTVATTLPTLKPNKDGYYPMKVNMRHIAPTKKLQFWPSTQDIKTAAGVAPASSVSVAAAKDYYFLDENGEVTETVKGDAANMTVVPYLKAGQTYDSAFITVEATADDQKALETYAAAEPESNNTNSSSSGCNLGFVSCGLIAAASLFLKKKKS